MAAGGAAARKRERPTLGVLAGWQVYERTTPNWFLSALFQGMTESGRALGCDVLLSCGVGDRTDEPRMVRPGWPVVCDEADFVPVGPWNTDGIVVISPLRTELRRGFVRGLQQEGFPLVFVGPGDGTPAVIADSEMGLRGALEHLRGHGHRRVAYIAGDPGDPGDSFARLGHYRRLRRELELEADEALIEPGLHNERGGYAAMQAILGRGRPFTALLASNDRSAIGAMQALSEAGLRVPEDVAVVGFDDTPESSAHVPPLATVRYPLVETGRKAVERLVDVILGSPGPDTIAIATTFVGRRSCGCLPHTLLPIAVPTRSSAEPHQEIAHAMAAEAAQQGATLVAEAGFGLCRRLVAGLEASLAEGRREPFEDALTELLQRVESAGDRAHCWQAALSRLRSDLPGLLQRLGLDAKAADADELLHLGRLALSESAEREGERQRLLDSQQADRVSALTVPLQSAQDEEEILELLAEHAPGLGARPVCVALYEAEGEDSVAWSKARLLQADSRRWSEPLRSPTREIVDVLPGGDAPRTLALLPLVRHSRPLGFLALEATSLAPCASIALQLAVALESVRLHAAVRSLTVTDELTGLHNRRFFEADLRREADRSRRFGRDIALVMVDVDQFKAYNDSFGHRAGDDALRRIARHLLDAVLRRLDAVSRYGGEEFAVLLAETDLEGARCVAERIRRSVEASADFLRPLTISAGVAGLKGEASDPEELVLRADRALYRAKELGRNRVCG